MRAAKVPVLARMKESCAAAFTVDELNGINAFYESSARRAWLEKGRILMRPALAQAIADVVPGVFADTQTRSCARMGGCETAPAAPAPAAPISSTRQNRRIRPLSLLGPIRHSQSRKGVV